MYNTREYDSKHISSGTTTTIFTGKGVLQAITVNTTANGTITITDGSIGSVKGILKASVAENTYWYNMSMASGCSIVTAAASDLTVTYAQA